MKKCAFQQEAFSKIYDSECSNGLDLERVTLEWGDGNVCGRSTPNKAIEKEKERLCENLALIFRGVMVGSVERQSENDQVVDTRVGGFDNMIKCIGKYEKENKGGKSKTKRMQGFGLEGLHTQWKAFKGYIFTIKFYVLH